MTRACARYVAVRNFRDLVAWQLAYELKCEVFACTAIGAASKDFKYRDQIRSSSASAPSNISEGFGRFRPREFARFLEYARASLMETQNHLLDGRDRGYLDTALYSRLSNLARSALKTTTNLMRAKQRQAAEESRNAPERRGGAPWKP
jgi:four helix bundle protein